MGSPLFGALILIETVGYYNISDQAVIVSLAWTLCYLVAAFVLHLATWATFDRFLGRTTGRKRRAQAAQHEVVRKIVPTSHIQKASRRKQRKAVRAMAGHQGVPGGTDGLDSLLRAAERLGWKRVKEIVDGVLSALA